MKSTKVNSDSTLNDSSVTFTNRQKRWWVDSQTRPTVKAGVPTVPELMYFFFFPFFFGFRTYRYELVTNVHN